MSSRGADWTLGVGRLARDRICSDNKFHTAHPPAGHAAVYVTKLSRHRCILGSHPASTAVDLSPSKEVQALSWALISQCLMRAQSLTRPPAGHHRTGSGTAHNTQGGDKHRELGHAETSTEAMLWAGESVCVCLVRTARHLVLGLNGRAPKLSLGQLNIVRLRRESSNINEGHRADKGWHVPLLDEGHS